MARHTSRMGLLTMIASSVRTAMRPGSAGISERAAAVPRMLRAMARGEYRGATLSHVALLAAAAFYVVSPLDFVPEAFFGVLGIADDAVVVSWLVAALVNDTEAFLNWESAMGRYAGSAASSGSGRSSGSAGSTGFAGSSGPAGSAGFAGPQDMPSEEYHRTVRSHVVS